MSQIPHCSVKKDQRGNFGGGMSLLPPPSVGIDLKELGVSCRNVGNFGQ